MRKIPVGCEAVNLMVGLVPDTWNVSKQISAFIRFAQAKHFVDITEVALPTRFLFIMLGPGKYVNFESINRSDYKAFQHFFRQLPLPSGPLFGHTFVR